MIFGELSKERAQKIEEMLRMVITKGEERGRDSFGVVSVKRDGSITVFKREG